MNTEKITKNQILIYCMGRGSQSRDLPVALKQAVNRQCTYASASVCPGSERPAHITTSQELSSARAQGYRHGTKKLAN